MADTMEPSSRVLIAAVDPAVRDALSTALSAWGIETVVTRNGDETLAALLADCGPQVALLDSCVSRPEGPEICREVRRRGGMAPPYLIVLTGEASDNDVRAALDGGADDYLQKPWQKEALRARVTAGRRIVEYRSRLVERARELEEAVESLRRSEERYALAARAANDCLWEWQLEANLLYLAPRWASILGYEETEIGTSPDEWLDRVHPRDRERVEAALEAHVEGRTEAFDCEHRLRHRDGTYRWIHAKGLTVRDDEAHATRVVGSMTDITDHKAADEMSRHFASHDALTGLRNRLSFLDRVRYALAHSRRRGNRLYAVLCLDLDGFKAINDTLGHDFGDLLLKAIAARLVLCVREVDGLGRLGGDGFSVLLDDIAAPADAVRVARRIVEALGKPFDIDGQEAFVSGSIGIALDQGRYERPEDLLRDADTALYRAKQQGRGNFEVFDPAVHAQTTGRLRLENELRRAVEHNDFSVHYQPIVSLGTGKIAGFEALVRWSHAERGLISPAEFIPVAEETGTILSLGPWVLENACQQLCDWHESHPMSPPLAVHVNLSGKELMQEDLPPRVAETLRRTGLDPSALKLEITESALMEDCDATATMLSRLKALNVELHIDDFGTGYSSLSYLHQFPMDMLKIDRSFIIRAGVDEDSLTIVQTIIGLARDLGMAVVAEGIEERAQLDHLRELQCEYGQGYLFAAPRDAEGVEELLREDPQW